MTTQFKWHDGNANQTGEFQVQKNGDWVDMSQGFSISANTSAQFSFKTSFDGSSGAYVAFVMLSSDSIHQGVKLNPSESVSLPIDTGSTDIEFVASVLVSDDPKVNVTTSRTGSATCYLAWDGNTWTLTGDGAPTGGGDTFNVTAAQVTVHVSSTQSNTSVSIYESQNTANTLGSILAHASGSVSHTITSSGSYTVNVFRPLTSTATLLVS
jgi:hypothetical protein